MEKERSPRKFAHNAVGSSVASSAGIFEDKSGVMQYYAKDCYACEVCCRDEEWYSYPMQYF